MVNNHDRNNIYAELYETSNDAPIHWSTKFGKGVKIGHGVVIEKGCVIGDNVKIGHNCVIKSGVNISSNKDIKDLTVVKRSI